MPALPLGDGNSLGPLALVNAVVRTLDPRRPEATALAIENNRITCVGNRDEVLAAAGPSATIVDTEGGLVIPAFHDAHLHLLSYARRRLRLDCRDATSIHSIKQALQRFAAEAQGGDGWIQAAGYDDARLDEGRHPTRADLDAAISDRPVRLQHRSGHLDVFNTPALHALGLSASPQVSRGRWLATAEGARVELDPPTGEPTGGVYNAGALLQRRKPRPGFEEIAGAVRQATAELLARGITAVQDATYTNGPDELALFERLAASGDLGVRLVLFRSADVWKAMPHATHAGVSLGPIKIMLDEATADLDAIRDTVADARRAGQSVAFHAVSEAEVMLAIAALESQPSRAARVRDRVEHGAVIPDALLADLKRLDVCIVGQPMLVYERGAEYRKLYPPEQHGWLHRAGSLLTAGVPYAAGSDAPVTEPDPTLGVWAAQQRIPRGDNVLLGGEERLTRDRGLAAHTLWPARAIGAQRKLGMLRAGRVADIAVLDPDALESGEPGRHARLTIMEGRVVWRRGG